MSVSQSLAGTGRPYADIQFRLVGGSQVRFQGAGPSSNRPYGVSITIEVPSDLATWMSKLSATLGSAAGTSAKYIKAQAAILDDDRVRVQVAGPKLNRAYGAVFAVRDAALCQFVAQAIEQAQSAPTAVEPAAPTTMVEMI